MHNFKSIYFVILFLVIYKNNAQISDKRLCVDLKCSEPASLAKTLLRYSSPDSRILSFAPNQEVKVFSKEAGSMTNLWGVEINGKKGYVPKHLLREYKIIKKPTLLVDTESKSQVPTNHENKVLEPNKVKNEFEVVDGTTIYLNPQDSINPSSSESVVQPTALPSNAEETGNKSKEIGDSKPATLIKETEALPTNSQETLANNVVSTINGGVKNNTDSLEAETEEDDDDDEDEDDDDYDYEEDLEESELLATSENEDSILPKPDLNLLHNLPPGIAVSLYNAEITKNESDIKSDAKEEHSPSEQDADIKNSLPSSFPAENSINMAVSPDTQATINPDSPSLTADESKVENLPGDPSNSLTVGETNSVAENNVLDAISPDIQATNNKAIPVTQKDESIVVENRENLSLPVGETSQSTVSNIVSSENSRNFSASLTKDSVAQQPDESIKDIKDKTPALENNAAESITTEATIELGEQLPIVEGVTPNPMKTSPKEEPKTELKTEQSNNDASSYKTDDYSEKEGTVPEEDAMHINSETNSPRQDQNNLKQDQSENVKDLEMPPPLPSPSEPFFGLGQSPPDIKNDDKQTVDDGFSQDSGKTTENGSPEKSKSVNDFTEEKPEYTENTESSTEYSENVNLDNSPEEDPNGVNNVEEGGVFNSEDIHIQQENVPSKSDLDSGEDTKEAKEDNGESSGLLSGLLSYFSDKTEAVDSTLTEGSGKVEDTQEQGVWSQPKESVIDYCDVNNELCNSDTASEPTALGGFLEDIQFSFNADVFLYLITTAISVMVFLFGYMLLDKSRREAPFVARINKLEKQLLVTLKENELLQEKGAVSSLPEDVVPSYVIEELKQRLSEMQLENHSLVMRLAELEKDIESKQVLEEQIESLEKELETSTEVGMELNRIISEMLDPTNGSNWLKENVEQLQRQLLEQKDTINTISLTLEEKLAENKVLRTESETSKKVSGELQKKLNEMIDKTMKIENEMEQQQSMLKNELGIYQQKYSEAVGKADILDNEIQILRVQLVEAQRHAELKTKEYQTLQDSLEKIKTISRDKDAMRSLLDATSIKAELQQLKSDNEKYAEQLQVEQSHKIAYEKKYQTVAEEIASMRDKYEQAEKEKVEANSRLEVLNNYFKKREAELQEEVIKYKSIWDAKEGEATSTTERIKYMQEDIENYKVQNEALKQEIISQEIELKSQISMLEKKVHENWVTSRQAERKLEDARQEAAQLRHRLTLRERALIENRLQSPMEQNGELPLSPHPIDSPASPPLLFGTRDHITKSPPLPGLPPFLPPPPGAPFMPPPLHGMPPFMPPPPSMFPGDHRPPPLGRMSSPPLNSRYSPNTSAFSPYDRNSPSPPYDSEYGASPPPIRGYSPYNDRRDYKRPPHVRTNGRNMKGSIISSGSDHSNDSIEKRNRKQSKKV